MDVNGVYKPTSNLGAPSCMSCIRFDFRDLPIVAPQTLEPMVEPVTKSAVEGAVTGFLHRMGQGFTTNSWRLSWGKQGTMMISWMFKVGRNLSGNTWHWWSKYDSPWMAAQVWSWRRPTFISGGLWDSPESQVLWGSDNHNNSQKDRNMFPGCYGRCFAHEFPAFFNFSQLF